jgi:hypothetical protein
MNIAAPASRQPDPIDGCFLVGVTAGEERQHDGADRDVGSADARAPIPCAGQLRTASDAVRLVICATMVREGSLDASRGMVGTYSDAKTDAAITKAAFDTAADGAHRTVADGLIALTVGPT